MRLALALFMQLLAALPARAEGLRVVTDIAVVQSLAAQVMGDGSAPVALVGQGASVHANALRPSEARALAQADVVIWVGPALTPWLEDAVASLAGEAAILRLLDVAGTRLLPLREDALFEGVEHGHDHGHSDEGHGHDHDEHGHDGSGDDHGSADGADATGATGIDPHAWLDPENALLWLGAIAEALATADPGNAALYRANADRARAELRALVAGFAPPPEGAHIAALHDAYQYLETGLGVRLLGAVQLGDASAAGPARLRALRDAFEAAGLACLWVEPQTDPRAWRAVTGARPLRAIERDPAGADLAPGPALYSNLLAALMQDVQDCAADSH